MKELIVAMLLLAGTGGGAMVMTGHGADLKDTITGAVPADIRSATEDVRSHIPSGKPEQPGLDTAGEPSDARPARATTMTIGHTDGIGVSLRSGCADDDRIAGSLPDGTVVSVTEHGSGPCANWSLVASDGGVTTWVRNRYLLAAPATDPEKSNTGSGDGPKRDKLHGESNDDDAGDESQDKSDGARRDEGPAHSAAEWPVQPAGAPAD